MSPYSGEPWVYGRFYIFFSFHLAQTPLAEVAPTGEVGIERRTQGNVLSSAAVFAHRCDFGQWRLRVMVGEKPYKNRP